MTLTLELPPDLECRVNSEAARRGSPHARDPPAAAPHGLLPPSPVPREGRRRRLRRSRREPPQPVPPHGRDQRLLRRVGEPPARQPPQAAEVVEVTERRLPSLPPDLRQRP